MLEAAERAAIGGDLASAEKLLSDAARIQEAEQGPLHPDLANTLNNLAIVTEKTGRPGDAETFYRQAASIAAASLPADDPMVAASRENLEAFCRARGLPIDAPAFVASAAPDMRAAGSSERLGHVGVGRDRCVRPGDSDGPRVATVVVAGNVDIRTGVTTRAAASNQACVTAASRAGRHAGSC